MIVFTHLLLSRMIRTQLRKTGSLLVARSFAYGNIKPDVSTMIRTQRHNITDSGEYIRNCISALAQSPFFGHRRSYSFRLGILCHYMTDFFTYAHNTCFDGSFKEHMNYELNIHEHVLDFNNALQNTDLVLHNGPLPGDLPSLLEYIDRMHDLYLSDVTVNPQRDFAFAINVCSVMCRTLVAISSRHHRFAPVIGF